MKDELLARLRRVGHGRLHDHEFQQAAFDYVAHCMAVQKHPGADVNGGCRYFVGGNRCAIGHLIGAENYYPELEEYETFEEPVIKALLKNGVYVGDTTKTNRRDEFLSDLQRAHDFAVGAARRARWFNTAARRIKSFGKSFREHMEKLAHKYNLTTKHPALR